MNRRYDYTPASSRYTISSLTPSKVISAVREPPTNQSTLPSQTILQPLYGPSRVLPSQSFIQSYSQNKGSRYNNPRTVIENRRTSPPKGVPTSSPKAAAFDMAMMKDLRYNPNKKNNAGNPVSYNLVNSYAPSPTGTYALTPSKPYSDNLPQKVNHRKKEKGRERENAKENEKLRDDIVKIDVSDSADDEEESFIEQLSIPDAGDFVLVGTLGTLVDEVSSKFKRISKSAVRRLSNKRTSFRMIQKRLSQKSQYEKSVGGGSTRGSSQTRRSRTSRKSKQTNTKGSEVYFTHQRSSSSTLDTKEMEEICEYPVSRRSRSQHRAVQAAAQANQLNSVMSALHPSLIAKLRKGQLPNRMNR